MSITKDFWHNTDPKQIMGGTNFPGDELFEVISPDAHIIDLGCGNGETSNFLQSKGYTVTGVDINSAAIESNRIKYPQVDFVQADIVGELPIDDASVDVVVLSYVLVSLCKESEQKSLVNSIKRILKPGGIVWIKEALISEDYAPRYQLSKQLLDSDFLDYSFYIFKSKDVDYTKLNLEDMEQLIKDNQVERIACHYEVDELIALFDSFENLSSQRIEIISPNSGMRINSLVAIFQMQ